jgi:hypothetical protein
MKETTLIIEQVDDHPSRFDQQFNALWELYPRKVGKAQATKALRVRLRTTSFDQLLNATTNYAAFRVGQDPAFTMHPATFWGPSERWRDYLDDSPELAIARCAKQSREQIADAVNDAFQEMIHLFALYRDESIPRPVQNSLVEKLLVAYPLARWGRMTETEVRNALEAAAYDTNGNGALCR